MKILSTLAFFVAVSTATAQDLHVYFDVMGDSIYFMKNGKVVIQPEVKKGQQIMIHVTNYNNYLYDVQLEVEDKRIQMADRSDNGGIGEGGSGGSSMLNLVMGTMGPGFGLAGLPNIMDIFSKNMGFAATDAQEDRDELKVKMEGMDLAIKENIKEFKKISSEIESLDEEIPAIIDLIKLQHFAHDEIYRVRYDSQLTPEQLKNMAREYADVVFGEINPDNINLASLRQRKDQRTILRERMAAYAQLVAQFKATIVRNKDLIEELQNFPVKDENYPTYLHSVRTTQIVAETKVAIYEQRIEEIQKAYDSVEEFSTAKLTALRTVYAAILQNPFSKTYPYEADGEVMMFKVQLTPLDSIQYASLKTIHMAPVRVKIVGGIRITSSIGLGFGQYFKQPQSYFIRDSIIHGSKKDAFVPQLTSFIHFYYPTTRYINWGGSIGVGMPLSGGDGLQSLSFFIGPSMILGQNGRIVISTGMMGGRVAKPSQGYEVGDRFEDDPSYFSTENQYQLGMFFSASINLAAK